MTETDKSTVNRIITEVAESEEVHILELPQFGNTVDPDALENLLDSSEDICIEFEYAEYEVEATSEGVSINGV